MAENSPERWLQSQTSDLLETAILLLDRLHCPPFELGWLHSESGQTYRTLLLEVERVLLEVWEATQNKKFAELEDSLQLWFQDQLRQENGLFRQYQRLHEALEDWRHTPEPQQQGLQGWLDFQLHMLVQEPTLLVRKAEDAQVSIEELEILSGKTLAWVQPLASETPHDLLDEFFTLLRPFTKTHPELLPLDHLQPPPASRNAPLLDQLRSALNDQDDWESSGIELANWLREAVVFHSAK